MYTFLKHLNPWVKNESSYVYIAEQTGMATNLRERKLWIQTGKTLLKKPPKNSLIHEEGLVNA